MAAPETKGQITQAILAALREHYFYDPVVEITEVQANHLRIRVGQDRGGPRCFNVKISQEICHDQNDTSST